MKDSEKNKQQLISEVEELRKQIEQLNQTTVSEKERFDLAMNATSDGLYDWDLVTEMTQMSLFPNSREFQFQNNIIASAQRAKNLVEKILLISHSSMGHMELVQLKTLVNESHSF